MHRIHACLKFVPAVFLLFNLSGCVSTVVGTAVDAAIEVAKVPVKAGKAIVGVATEDDDKDD